MRTLTPFLFAVVGYFACCLPALPSDGQPTLDDLEAHIREKDLSEVLAFVQESKYRCPTIHSLWYVKHHSPEDVREDMLRHRAIGKLFAKRISDWAPSVVASQESADVREEIGRLLALGDWLAEPQGYGNLLLGARCLDVASVGVAHLVIDLDYPMEDLTNCVSALQPSWCAASVRLAMLNEEAATNLFVSASANDADTQLVLEDTWRSGSVLLQMEANPAIKDAARGTPPKGLEHLTALLKRAKVKNLESPLLLANVDFFQDDPLATLPRPLTLENTWNSKRHEPFTVGLVPPNLYLIESLMSFRASVGHFPADRGGFEAAWLSHCEPATRKLYAPAWRAYHAICQGRFVDEDTRQTKE